MPGYAILHFEKIKDVGSIKRLSQHHERSGSDVFNAKPPFDARIFSGSGSMVSDVLARLPEKRRSDAVLAIEIMLTTSPESMRFNDDISAELDSVKVKKFEAAAKEFLEKEFRGTATTRIHFDEKTPHVQGFIVPNENYEAGAKLNAKKLFSPTTLEDFQTKWASYCVAAGLDVKRGENGSQAKHERISAYYARVNASIPAPPALAQKPAEATVSEKAKEALGLETEHSKAVATRNQSKQARAAFLEKNYTSAVQNAAELKAKKDEAEARARRAEEKLLSLKRQAADLRSLPLAEVLESLGCTKHKTDKLRWETPAGGVWIEKGGQRFNSFDDDKLKGRGAIDLVMKINGATFDEASALLAKRYGLEATGSDAAGFMSESVRESVKNAARDVLEPSKLPTPSPGVLVRARAYLVTVRGISESIVDRLVTEGRIYADKFANCIFLTDDKKGCEIRGTTEKPFHGHRGQKTGFTVLGDPKRVVIVESAVEALSCNQVTGMTAVSVGGSNPSKAAEIAKMWTTRGATVFAGQNADAAGEKQAAALLQAVPGVHRSKPRFDLIDWNDSLRASNEKRDQKTNLRTSLKQQKVQ